MITTVRVLPSTSHKLILLEANPVTTQNRHLPPDAPLVKLLGQESVSHTKQKKPSEQVAGVTLLEGGSMALSSLSPSATSGQRKTKWDFEFKKISGGMTKAKRSHPLCDWPRPLHICPWTRDPGTEACLSTPLQYLLQAAQWAICCQTFLQKASNPISLGGWKLGRRQLVIKGTY